MRERGGNVVVTVVPNTVIKKIQPISENTIPLGLEVFTDEWKA
mgnify:CR=1 FL=1|jgi:hypothetical protein